MRILHLNNLANVACELRDAQRRQGHEAIVVNTYKGSLPLNYPDDWRVYDESGLWGRLGYRLTLRHLIGWADVVHAHGGFWHRDLARLSQKKRFVIHYHGSDVRLSAPGVDARRCEAFAGRILLSTPDLLQYCPQGVYIPNPFTAPPLADRVSGGPIRVVHAYAGHQDPEAIKGTTTIRTAVQGLHGFEFIGVTGVRHDKALEVYRTCDVAVDQIKIGWYGMFALECMSMGIPTLGKVNAYRYREAPVPNPLVPADADTLRSALESMRDAARRRAVGADQRRFVVERHDPDRIAAEVLRIYEGI